MQIRLTPPRNPSMNPTSHCSVGPFRLCYWMRAAALPDGIDGTDAGLALSTGGRRLRWLPFVLVVAWLVSSVPLAALAAPGRLQSLGVLSGQAEGETSATVPAGSLGQPSSAEQSNASNRSPAAAADEAADGPVADSGTESGTASERTGAAPVGTRGGPDQSNSSSSAAEKRPVRFWRPLVATCVGIAVVLFLIIRLKTHAFLALILGALTISLFIPTDVVGFVKSPVPHVVLAPDGGQPANIVSRVASALGNSVTGIGILIAMAAIIGKCMLVSGAADQIVQSALRVFGERRASLAMMVSGFILSIPVFFDTVFYLLVPLARTLYRQTQKNYLLYLAAIAAGGAITHTLVPPTPGPLIVAQTLSVNLGTVIMLGLAIGAPSALVGLGVAAWLNRRMPIEMRPLSGAAQAQEDKELEKLPSLTLSLLPVVLPVLLIAMATVFGAIVGTTEPGTVLAFIQGWLDFFGKPDLAMIIAAILAIYLCYSVQGSTLEELAEYSEEALLSGGVIILITGAGGAFGALLAMTEIQNVVQSVFSGKEQGGLMLIVIAYAIAAAIKVAQGSSTVSMIITSSLVASIATPLAQSGELGYHMAYLVPVIGSGSLMGSWMNDSGFWVFAKMGVLTEGETLRSWTVLLACLSITGLLFCLLFAWLLPLA
ncbi:MAG: GntP family permease [Planctomycetota bacterium]|nr:MAG: GntP family permease [Planctomycetota bacterium]